MSEKIIVQKFGGTSVGSPERIKAVADRIKSYVDNNYKVIVVVSAMGDTTDHLIDLAQQISAKPSAREMDMLLSTGEQVSISLLAMALHEVKVEAVSFTGSQVKMITDGAHSNARIVSVDDKRLRKALEKHSVIVVAGFQGIDSDENITTLGRGGSDTSAVALAAALGVRDCEIYTDVDGVYTADPRVVGGARKLNEISYDEMLELARLGAGVLHSRSVEFGKKYNVRIHVRSSFNRNEGTIVKPREEMMEKFTMSGVTSKLDEVKFNIYGIPDCPGIAQKIFSVLGEEKIYVNMIVQSTGKDGKADISFTVLKKDIERVKVISEKIKTELKGDEVTCEDNIAIVSAVGVGMLSSAGVAGKLFKILSDHNINIQMISTSEIGISCVIDEMYAELAVKSIHKEFMEK
ncbi:MAG: aspartate kinase [Spirochaetes bacterium]|nr:aspartate kinase [Spirochaetota bacterium]